MLLDVRAARGVGVGRVVLRCHVVSCCRSWKSGIARLLIVVLCCGGLRDTPARYDLCAPESIARLGGLGVLCDAAIRIRV